MGTKLRPRQAARDAPALRHISGVPFEQLARIEAAMRGYTPSVTERDEPFFEAAVALILRAGEQKGVELLLIKRATREGDPWSGQIALPGGRRDATDASLAETAVRETREEVGLDLRLHGAMLGALDELRPRTPVLPPVVVRPYVFTVAGELSLEASEEVAEAFWAPLCEVLAPEATRETEITVRGARFVRPAIHYAGHEVWGLTEYILRGFEKVTA